MFELYFILYRIPKMMTALARERNRSALKWSLLGIAAWIGGELFAGLAFGVLYVAGIIFLGWPEELSPGMTLLLYVAALAAGIGAFTLVRRNLREKSANPSDSTDPLLQPPPPPPQF
jgi:ABC-type multidrug transport system permease subunit